MHAYETVEALIRGVRDGNNRPALRLPFGDNSAHIQQLADFLATNPAVRELDLSGCTINADDTKLLAAGLKANTTLTILNLYSNDLRDEGAAFIADALKANTTLTTLNLSSNAIGERGMNSLVDAMENNSTITSLLTLYNEPQQTQLAKINDYCARNRAISFVLDSFVPTLEGQLHLNIKHHPHISEEDKQRFNPRDHKEALRQIAAESLFSGFTLEDKVRFCQNYQPGTVTADTMRLYHHINLKIDTPYPIFGQSHFPSPLPSLIKRRIARLLPKDSPPVTVSILPGEIPDVYGYVHIRGIDARYKFETPNTSINVVNHDDGIVITGIAPATLCRMLDDCINGKAPSPLVPITPEVPLTEKITSYLKELLPEDQKPGVTMKASRNPSNEEGDIYITGIDNRFIFALPAPSMCAREGNGIRITGITPSNFCSLLDDCVYGRAPSILVPEPLAQTILESLQKLLISPPSDLTVSIKPSRTPHKQGDVHIHGIDKRLSLLFPHRHLGQIKDGNAMRLSSVTPSEFITMLQDRLSGKSPPIPPSAISR